MIEDPEYSVRLIAKDAIESFKGDSQVGVFIEVIEALAEDHELKNNISLPYAPGNKRAIINSEPKNTDGSEMHTFHELPNGLYINTNLNRGEKIKYINEFASECGLITHHSGWK
jgi:hypothetical protein